MIAIGLVDGTETHLLTEWGCGDEKTVISEFYNKLSHYGQENIIIGFNILHFDIPVLIFKGIEYGVGDTGTVYELWRRPFKIDYRQVSLPLNNMRFKGLSLAFLAKLLEEKGVPGVRKKEPGVEVIRLYDEQDYKTIEEHLHADLEIIQLVDRNWERLFGHGCQDCFSKN